jgi:flagellar motor switch/type III secretory pathway protein FliN
MPTLVENKVMANAPSGAAGVHAPGAPPNGAATPGLDADGAMGSALAVREEGLAEGFPEEGERDTRLDRLPMQVDVLLKVHSFRVQDLLSMEKGTVVETVHEHTQDVPVRCGGALLMWSEFEVLDQTLAVRITRLG